MQTNTTSKTKTLGFIKDNDIWYADLPQFLEHGLGTRENLMMVDGADTFLDILSNHSKQVIKNLLSAIRYPPFFKEE